MKTVAQHWHNFETLVMSPAAGSTQRTETRRAFYAGFNSCIVSLLQASDESGDDDDLGATMLEQLRAECERFSQAVMEGRA